MGDTQKGATIRETRTYRCPRCGRVGTITKVSELSGPKAMYQKRRGYGTLSNLTAKILSKLIDAAKRRMGWSDEDFARLGEGDVKALEKKMLDEGLSPVYVAQVVTAVRRAIRAAQGSKKG